MLAYQRVYGLFLVYNHVNQWGLLMIITPACVYRPKVVDTMLGLFV
jgi:hypothetical protein